MEKIMTDKQTFEEMFNEADKLSDELYITLLDDSKNYDSVIAIQSACMLILSEFSGIKNKKMREFALFLIDSELSQMMDGEHDEDDDSEMLSDFDMTNPIPGKPH
jgi:hypothetical protein